MLKFTHTPTRRQFTNYKCAKDDEYGQLIAFAYFT